MRPQALDLPFSPSRDSARLALRQTVAEHRFYGHLWVWLAAAVLLVGLDVGSGFDETPGLVLSAIWGAAVLLHYRRVVVGGRRRFLQQHSALTQASKEREDGVLNLRERLIEGLEEARDCLRTSSQDTLAGLVRGEHQALAMVAWLSDAEPLLAAQRTARRERRRVTAQLSRPGAADDRQLCRELLLLFDDNDRRLSRIERQAEERRQRVESFLLAVESTQLARRSGGEESDHGTVDATIQHRVGLLEQAIDGSDGQLAGPAAVGAESAGDAARIRQEVGLARELQLSILPSSAPHIPGLDVAHLYRPSSELGGDFYDFYAVPGDGGDPPRLLLALGDASGHGLDSSMVSSMAKSALYMQMSTQRDLAAIMSELNRMMCDTLGRRRMMTLALLELSVAAGRLRWANAGQLYPLLCRGHDVIELKQPGYPLGVRRQHAFSVEEVELFPGDQLVLLTDGLIEAERGGDIYGWPRLIEVLERRPAGGAQELIEYLVADLRQFMGAAEPQDDVTLLVLDVQTEGL